MRLSHDIAEFQLRGTFVTQQNAVPVRPRVILARLEWQSLIGMGIAIPFRTCGMTLSTLRAALDEFSPVLNEGTPYQIESQISRLAARLPGQWSALAAVDMAMHDLLGQAVGLPVHKLLGLDGLPLPCSAVSLGIMAPAEAEREAARLSDWPVIKLKLGRVPDYDMVRAVRGVYGGRLWVDGNGAWEPKQAIAVAEQLHRFNVELLEQPIPPGRLDDLRFVAERSPALVIADEDCQGPSDVVRLAGRVDGINIKLLKCGGISRALRMITLAREFGLKVMLGCNVESVLGTTAAAQLGGLADYLDLDGHLHLEADLFTGIALNAGRVILPEHAGLGVRPLA